MRKHRGKKSKRHYKGGMSKLNPADYDGKGVGNTLANGVGVDYSTIRGEINYTTAKIYLSTKCLIRVRN